DNTEQELYFTFDGHGSTRVLTDLAGAILELYNFDAYGNAIGFDPSVALTEFLYSGEQFDSKIGQQYLRARYYDPTTGRFNRLDPFFGNLNAPQSLHKYLYTHADPIQGVDPSGLSWGASICSSISIGTHMAVSGAAAGLRILATFSSNISLNLYVRGSVYLAHLMSKFPTATAITAEGLTVLNIYTTVTSPNPVESFMMGPVDDVYNMAQSLRNAVHTAKNATRSFHVVATMADSASSIRPLSVAALIDRKTLRTGSAANHSVIPAGYYDLPDITDDYQRARAHLLGKLLGGKGTKENLVALYQKANLRMYSMVERPIVQKIENGTYDEVCYFANAVHDGITNYPRAIEMYAFGVKDGVIESTPFIAVTILNQK
ncbi:MAG: DNA/RNA non-specific endonuclease, partial [Planctomycetaceae bacterium]|nr:DNA/RNA non-specific endonuclease [Planctomycetaceae bacterium]